MAVSRDTEPMGRVTKIRAAVFFLALVALNLTIGGWLTYTFGWTGFRPHLRAVGLPLGLVTLGSAGIPLWFFLAIIRQLVGQRE